MNRWIIGAKLVALTIFVLSSLALTLYDIYYVVPASRCERGGAWWDPKDRQCLTPLPIWRITGRGLETGPAAPAQRVAPGTQRTSPPSLAAATRAATNRKSESRFR